MLFSELNSVLVTSGRSVSCLLAGLEAIPTDPRSESHFNTTSLGFAVITRRKKQQAW
jgi:hypothetical protein